MKEKKLSESQTYLFEQFAVMTVKISKTQKQRIKLIETDVSNENGFRYMLIKEESIRC